MFTRRKRSIVSSIQNILLSSVAVFVLAVSAQAQESRPFPASWQAAIDSFTESGVLPGAVFLVKSPDWGLRVGVTGVSDIESNTPPSPDQHFRVGSVSKNFTSLVILQLEQEGKLRLDDPISKYLTGVNTLDLYADEITIGECLQHTGGIKNYLNDSFYNTYPLEATSELNITPEFIMSQINSLQAAEGPYFIPDATFTNPIKQYTLMQTPVSDIPGYPWWYYSNSHYTVLGIIAEQVTGMSLEDLIRTRVAEPGGLENTFYAIGSSVPENTMRGYSKMNSRGQPKTSTWQDVTIIDPSYAGAAGAVISTPMDLLKHLENTFTTDKIITKATRQKWFTFVTADPIWENLDYGVGGLMQDHTEFGDVRGHGGAIPGYHNLMYYIHDSDSYFVIVVNTWDDEYEVELMDAVMPLVTASVTTPKPLNGSENNTLDATTSGVKLSWQAGRTYGDTYNIYVGKNADAVDTATAATGDVMMYTSTTLSYDLPSLETDTQYYWRVDAVPNGEDVIHGPLWSFETGSVSTSIQSWILE